MPAEVTTDGYFDFWRNLAAADSRPDLGLSIGLAVFGRAVASMAAVQAPTVGDAIRTIGRYKRLVCPEEVLLETADGEGSLRCTWTLSTGEVPPLLVGAIFTSHCALLARAIAGAARPRRLELARRARHATMLRDHFRCPIVFGAAHDRIVFPEATLALPLVGANRSAYQQLLPDLEAQLVAKRSLMREVRLAAARTMGSGSSPSIGRIAHRLATSPRTLQRQLGHANTTFAAQLGDVRRVVARRVRHRRLAGIGLETTRVLAAAGARVVVPARDLPKARAALEGMPHVVIEPMDLARPETIDAFAARTNEPVHLLINNAGIMAVPLSRDARGIESQLAVNHVGHFQLFLHLLDRLKAARGARVLAVSSRGHVRSAFDFEDPNFERRPYEKMVAYGQSKTANILFAFEADCRFQAEGIRVFSLHAGAILDTQLARHYDPEELKVVVERAKKISSMKTISQGAATTIFAATSPLLTAKGGVYLVDCDIAKIGDGDHEVRSYAIDGENAKRLWAWTERQI